MIFCRKANLRSISLQEWNMFYNDICPSFKGISIFIQLHTIKKKVEHMSLSCNKEKCDFKRHHNCNRQEQI